MPDIVERLRRHRWLGKEMDETQGKLHEANLALRKENETLRAGIEKAIRIMGGEPPDISPNCNEGNDK